MMEQFSVVSMLQGGGSEWKQVGRLMEIGGGQARTETNKSPRASQSQLPWLGQLKTICSYQDQ